MTLRRSDIFQTITVHLNSVNQPDCKEKVTDYDIKNETTQILHCPIG